MKKIKLNFSEFNTNSESISEFLSKKAMGQIIGGVDPYYCESCSTTLPPYSQSIPKYTQAV